MPARSDVYVIRNNMPQIEKALHQAMADVLVQVGLLVVSAAKQNIVQWDLIDTGNLLNSIYLQTFTDPGVPAGIQFLGMPGTPPQNDTEINVNVGAYYGVYHEYGTAHLPAKPYLVPALESATERMMPLIRTTFQRYGL
jgi:hypothetical protein